MKLYSGLFASLLFASVKVSDSLDPTDYAECKAYPDPHFSTWHDPSYSYSYHGQCDLVLIKNEEFASNVGLYLHIRTEDAGGWSKITKAALRINNDILEVQEGGAYYVDGVLNPALPIDIGNYPLTITTVGTTDTFKVDLGDTQYVEIMRSSYITVEARGHGEEFLNSVGLCGTWKTPGKIARDGGTDFTDPNEFGEDWQVRNTEPLLFQPVPVGVGGIHPSPQYPEACLKAPDVSGRFTDNAVAIAKAACNDVVENLKEPCEWDVVVTGDTDWADQYKAAGDPIPCEEECCTKIGGECVNDGSCDPAAHECVERLCCPLGVRCDCICKVSNRGTGRRNVRRAKQHEENQVQDEDGI